MRANLPAGARGGCQRPPRTILYSAGIAVPQFAAVFVARLQAAGGGMRAAGRGVAAHGGRDGWRTSHAVARSGSTRRGGGGGGGCVRAGGRTVRWPAEPAMQGASRRVGKASNGRTPRLHGWRLPAGRREATRGIPCCPRLAQPTHDAASKGNRKLQLARARAGIAAACA